MRADACSVLHDREFDVKRISSQRSGTPVMCLILDSDQPIGDI